MIEGEDQLERRRARGCERVRGDRVGDVLGCREPAFPVGAQRDRLDPGPAQRHLLAEPGRVGEPGEPDPGPGSGVTLVEVAGGDVSRCLDELGRRAVCAGAGADHERRLRVGNAGLGDHDRLLDGVAVRERLDQPRRPLGPVAAAVGRGEDHGLLAARAAEVVGEGEQGRRRRSARRRARALGRVAGGDDQDRPVGDPGQGEDDVLELDVLAVEARVERLRRDLAALDRREALLDEVGGGAVAARARRPVGGEGDDRACRPGCLGPVERRGRDRGLERVRYRREREHEHDERDERGQQCGAVDPRVEHRWGGETNLSAWPKPRLASSSSTTRSRFRRFWRTRSARRATRSWSPAMVARGSTSSPAGASISSSST